MQETHSTERNEVAWKREWGAPLYYSHGANNARGVVILIRNKFDCIVQESVTDADGRFLMLKVLLNGEQALLVNVYGPNRDSQLSSFYQNLLTHILEKGFDTIDNIIIGGDFNCPLNPIVDKRGGNLIPRQSVINSIGYLQSELDLHDIWRIKNPTLRSFTWSQSEPLIFSRLDYWLISNFLSDCVTEVDIIPAIKTDHSAIVIELQSTDDMARGPGIWKLNCSLLSDDGYVEEMNQLIPIWAQEGVADLSDSRSIWDWVKYNISKFSRKYSKEKSKQRRLDEEQLHREFHEASLSFQNDPSQENLAKLNVLKERTEKFYEKKVEGIIVRSRARWHEYGERNSKYFYNLEKRNHIRKHIRKLRLSGVITTDPYEILNAEKKYYENLYKKRLDVLEQNASTFCYDDLPIPTLSPEKMEIGEGPISLEECTEVLKSFSLNKVPGNDGLPVEFYKTFWGTVGDLLVKCYNESYEKGEMSSSQKQAIITLIDKKDQDRCDLKNWRPISLLNVDTKIASKVIAERIKKQLPEIIHKNQSGYITGRYIGENIRSILDILDYTKAKNLPGFFLFIDFEKAFDSLDWTFLNRCLELFHFGPSFVRWINVFYKNIQSCTINNGLCTNYFTIERGVRQGDPLSPYLFLIAVEILAIAVRAEKNIRGIEINGTETKLLQFADDTTAVLSDLNSAKAFFNLLDDFEKVSGLKLNVEKTEAMWIGSFNNRVDTPFGVKWQKCVKFLGIFITYDVQLLVEKNFKQRLKKVKNTINSWKIRGLSIYGKVNIIKSILFPKMIYPSSILCTPVEIIKEFQALIFNFLWNGKDKVIRLSTYAPYEFGGLKMIDYESMIKALRLSWLKRIFDKNCNGFWKSYFNYLLKNQGGQFLLECNYSSDQIDIPSSFYQELLIWWQKIRETADPDNNCKYIIWNNKEILIDGNSVFYKKYFVKGIKYTNDLLFDMNNIESFNIMKRKGLVSNFLIWTGLRKSVPLHLREQKSNSNVIFDVGNYRCRHYYSILIKFIYERPKKWLMLADKFNLTEEQLSKTYLLPLHVASEPYVRSFQYKVLNCILFTNDLLFKIGYIASPNCTFCKEALETIQHFLFYCAVSQAFWNDVIYNIPSKLSSCGYLLLSDVIVGFLREEMGLENYVLLLGKIYLWDCRRNDNKPSITHFIQILKNKYDTEKLIAQKQNKYQSFKNKWHLYERHFLYL